MSLTKNLVKTAFFLAGVAGLGVGLRQSLNSNLFLLQRVEVRTHRSNPPVNTQTILHLASVPVGKVSLFAVQLKDIEKRILTLDWVRDVRIERNLPHTLLMTVNFREPVAIVQLPKGILAYTDNEGTIFGRIHLNEIPDLPFLAGMSSDRRERILNALRVVRHWDNSLLNPLSNLSTIHWDTEKGYRVLASYDLSKNNPVRTMIDLGHEIDETLDEKLQRLLEVFHYLSGKSIAARQIWVDAGRKVVVKTAHGS